MAGILTLVVTELLIAMFISPELALITAIVAIIWLMKQLDQKGGV